MQLPAANGQELLWRSGRRLGHVGQVEHLVQLWSPALVGMGRRQHCAAQSRARHCLIATASWAHSQRWWGALGPDADEVPQQAADFGRERHKLLWAALGACNACAAPRPAGRLHESRPSRAAAGRSRRPAWHRSRARRPAAWQ